MVLIHMYADVTLLGVHQIMEAIEFNSNFTEWNLIRGNIY